MDDAAWITSAYEVLKRFLGIARHEHELMSFKQCSEVVWSTNDRDSIRASPGWMMKGHPNDMQAMAERCKAGLNALLLQAMMIPDERRRPLITSLLGVVTSLAELGVGIESFHSDTCVCCWP
jgi:hypothetical protein